MLSPKTRFVVARIPLEQIVATMHEVRYVKRFTEYLDGLLEHPDHDVLLMLAPLGILEDGRLMYRLLDGHHRFLALHAAGRTDAVAMIHYEPTDADYGFAKAPQ